MSEYETVLAYLRERCVEVRGQWNGDEAGYQEHRADMSAELLELLDQIDVLVKDLDL